MRRRTKLLLLSAAVGAGGAIALAGAIPEGFETVTDVAADPDRFYGREVHIKAIVGDEILSQARGSAFVLTDTVSRLRVTFPASLPENFEPGRTVLVAGVLLSVGGEPVLHATDIQGGCASRYEPRI